MASNPMQRKSRNSFLLGMLTMLLIASIIVGLLLWQLISLKKAEQEAKKNSVTIYVLAKDAASGQEITEDMITTKVIDKTLVPSNSFGNMEAIKNYSLQDDKGNPVSTGKDSTTGDSYLYIEENGIQVRIFKNPDGSYYKQNSNNQKEAVTLSNIPLVAKVNMKANAVLTKDVVTKSDEKVTKDVRKQEYNMITLPTQIKDNDVIDIRLRLPSGEDYIVVSKKRVTIPKIGGVDDENTIWVNLSEDETLSISNAIVEASIMRGSELYATTYVEPGMQEVATPTYPISAEVMQLLNSNPNVLEEAKQALWARYNAGDGQGQRNNHVNRELQKYTDEAKANIESNIEKQLTQRKETRKKYLDSLSAEAVE